MKVMLVDDHPLFLEGLQYLLETHGIEVAGTAGNGSQVIDRARLLEEFARQAAEKKPDITTGQEKTPGKLTRRQADVLNLVAQGMTYKEVGAALGLSERTIKYHMERILELLRLENRVQAIAYANQLISHS